MKPILLARLRAITTSWLTETCTIEREILGVGVMGEETHDWQLIASGVKCRVITSTTMGSTSQTQAVGNQESLVDTYRIVFPYGTNLGVNMRITVNGLVYTVISVLTGRTDETDTQAVCVRVHG